MYSCPSCNAQAVPSDIFCKGCGRQLESPLGEPIAAPSPTDSPLTAPPPDLWSTSPSPTHAPSPPAQQVVAQPPNPSAGPAVFTPQGPPPTQAPPPPRQFVAQPPNPSAGPAVLTPQGPPPTQASPPPRQFVAQPPNPSAGPAVFTPQGPPPTQAPPPPRQFVAQPPNPTARPTPGEAPPSAGDQQTIRRLDVSSTVNTNIKGQLNLTARGATLSTGSMEFVIRPEDICQITVRSRSGVPPGWVLAWAVWVLFALGLFVSRPKLITFVVLAIITLAFIYFGHRSGVQWRPAPRTDVTLVSVGAIGHPNQPGMQEAMSEHGFTTSVEEDFFFDESGHSLSVRLTDDKAALFAAELGAAIVGLRQSGLGPTLAALETGGTLDPSRERRIPIRSAPDEQLVNFALFWRWWNSRWWIGRDLKSARCLRAVEELGLV